MAHRDTVADPDRVKLKGDATGLGDALLDPLRDLVQMAMTGNDLHIGITNRNKGFFEVIPFHTCRHQQSSMGCPLKTALHLIAIHE